MTHTGPIDEAAEEAEGGAPEPPLVGPGEAEVGTALAGGAVIAVPAVGGYSLVVHVGSPGGEERLTALAADPEGPHYAVGHVDDVRQLTSGWSDEVQQLLQRCWPGPVEVFLPRARDAGPDPGPGQPYDQVADDSGGWAVTVGMPEGRALRKLCREHGPWRTVPLNFTDAGQVAHAFVASQVALVVDGGSREGEPATLVDATVSPVRVLREGALPADFVQATMAMGNRKKWFSRSRRDEE
jgi:L-threonylcarbamoyladenylate synthase